MFVVLGCLFAIGAPALAQIVSVDLGGVNSYNGWQSITQARFPGYGGFPGGSTWPSPIGSNAPGSGDAHLERLNGGGGGGPFPAGEAIYFGSFLQIPNQLGGTLRVADSRPVSGVKTVVFQIQIGEAVGHDFVDTTGAPVLKVNGQAAARASRAPVLIDRYQDGFFFSPETEQEEPVYVNTWGFQWDVSSLGTITSLQVDFSAVTHAQIYALRLDQSSAPHASSVFGASSDTRIISVPAALDFGSSPVGATHQLMLNISNTGNSPLNVTEISFPDGFSGTWSGRIPSGGSQNVEVSFVPAAAGRFAGNIVVLSDATSGVGSVLVGGVGIAPALTPRAPGPMQFSGTNTTVTQTFNSTPATWLNVEFTDNLADPNSWTRHPAAVYSGAGEFSVTFTKSGDQRVNWQRGMFFRLIY